MSYVVLDSIKNQDRNTLREQFALDVLTGFSNSQKYLPSKYFYDDLGSELFAKITETEDYYPTNCEFDVFNSNKEEITKVFKTDQHCNLIELGAGDGRKTKVLLEAFQKENLSFEYLPIDISEAAIDGLMQTMQREFPDLKQQGIVGEYRDALEWVNKNKQGKNIVLFLGSTIGNFSRSHALVFLRVLWKKLNTDDLLLIGFDLKKDIDKMLWAYNDREGVTKKFNLNVLTRINNELGGEFDITKFDHFGTYNPQNGAMESYLISKEAQSVYISALEKKFSFREFEPIHMEYSYKYLQADIDFLASECGYEIVKTFYDSRRMYSDSLWRVKKV